ncbi:MAG TPA: hypothetical protein VFL83_02965 [Anaeromyxobacter sp.]|nr:hypothetical protein [Anaeromyxobacter sp.]
MARLTRLALVLALAATATGCRHFRESRRLDMSPFADNTMTTIGELRKFEKPPVWVHLRKYRTHATVVKTQEDYKPLSRMLRGIAFYSAQMVSIGDSALSDEKKLKELARYLEVVVREAAADEEAADWGVTPADIDRISADIKTKQTFLEGIAAAEPLVNASLRYGIKLLDKLDVDVSEAAAAISREVDAEFAAVNANVADVERVQQQLLRGFALLHQYRLGEEKALDQLRGVVPVSRETLGGGKRPSVKELDAFEAQLTAQLQRVEAAKKQLAPDLADYEGSMLELDALRASTLERMKLGRVTLILWARSHRNLGKGIAVPPAIDIAGMIKSSAMGAAKAAIPL